MPKPDKWIKRWSAFSRNSSDDYTVALARDGTWGCSCKGWIFQKERPRMDCKHILETKRDIERPPKPWPGVEAAMAILPPGPDREPPADLFLRALVEKAEAEYIEQGYMYSGHIGWREVDETCGTGWHLNLDGYLERAGCEGFALILPPKRRWHLICTLGLADKWQEKASYFYPRARDGEVCNVWWKLVQFRLCPRCRIWHREAEHDCRPEPWMTFLDNA